MIKYEYIRDMETEYHQKYCKLYNKTSQKFSSKIEQIWLVFSLSFLDIINSSFLRGGWCYEKRYWKWINKIWNGGEFIE